LISHCFDINASTSRTGPTPERADPGIGFASPGTVVRLIRIPRLKAKYRTRRKPSAANATGRASEPSCGHRCDERRPQPLRTKCQVTTNFETLRFYAFAAPGSCPA